MEGEDAATFYFFGVDKLREIRGRERPPGEKTNRQELCSSLLRAETFLLWVRVSPVMGRVSERDEPS